MKITQKQRIIILIILFCISSIVYVKTHYDIEKNLYRLFSNIQPHELAKLSVEKYLLEDKVVVPLGSFKKNSGAFVTIVNKKTGLRGCMGTVSPSVYYEDIEKEIVRTAISSATQDKRFPPIKKDELSNLSYSVDILEPFVTITSESQPDPKIFGIVVSTKDKNGVILPNINGVNDIKTQIKFAKINGGINDEEKIIKIQKFMTKRFN